ncbi:transcription antitermination factor NusB [candidate division KSB1 bacterium]|nr:transcription antitermination factor NusB [candidate division KSB1 bacterium]
MGKSGRRMAREHALQVLYSYEMTANPIQQVIENFPGEELSDENSAEFANNLIHKSIENISELDKRIKEKAFNWEFSRIAILDRLILRIGICELLLFEDIPPKVTINEAIEIAKKYSTEKSGIFINGILDSILQDLRKSGDLHKIGRGLLED